MLYVADAIHFFTLFYYIWVPLKELGNVLYLPKDGENNSSDDISIPMNSYQPPKVRSKTSIDE